MGGGGGFAASLIHELLSDLPAAAWASGLTVQCLTAVRFVVPSEYRLYSVRLRGWVPVCTAYVCVDGFPSTQ